MASPEEIKAARELQRQSGGELSYYDAKKQLAARPPKDFTRDNVSKLFAEIAELKERLASVSAELQGMRITGEGFAGEGPRGIMYMPPFPAAGNNGGSTSTITILADNAGGGAGEILLAPVEDPVGTWTVNARTLGNGGYLAMDTDVTTADVVTITGAALEVATEGTGAGHPLIDPPQYTEIDNTWTIGYRTLLDGTYTRVDQDIIAGTIVVEGATIYSSNTGDGYYIVNPSVGYDGPTGNTWTLESRTIDGYNGVTVEVDGTGADEKLRASLADQSVAITTNLDALTGYITITDGVIGLDLQFTTTDCTTPP